MAVDPQELRRRAVLNILREGTPQTITEISTRMDANYHTIRKAINELAELGLIRRTGGVRDKNYLWAAGGISPVPELYDPSNDRKVPLDEVAHASASGTPTSVKAASAFFEIVQQLMAAARGFAVGDGSVALDNKSLQALRHQCIVNKMYLNNLLGYYEQILQDPRLWNVDDLGQIGQFVKDKEYE